MFEKLEIIQMAQSLSQYAGARLGLVAQNVANADTPGYRARDLPEFAEIWRGFSAMRSTRPGHIASASTAFADPVERRRATDASPNGNSVSLEGEMVAMADLRQQNQMAQAVYRTVSSVLRSSLGVKE